MANAGFGVNRGLLPGATLAACPMIPRDWEPRDDGQRPVPGITMVSVETSLGVAEKALPKESMTAT